MVKLLRWDKYDPDFNECPAANVRKGFNLMDNLDKFYAVLQRFAPESLEIIEKRYLLLRQLLHYQPVGRRLLGKELGFSERMVRNEIELLRARGIVYYTAAGIYLTTYGEKLLADIDGLTPFIFNIQTLAEKVKHMFKLKEVIIVPGDSQDDYLVKRDLGRAAARFLMKNLYPGATVAVTGGSTLAEMATAFGNGINAKDILVVPARGGLGEEMEQQAGAIAARIAGAIGAQYRLLHIPDSLEKNTVEILKNDLHIKAVVDDIRNSDILLHGIGAAMEMANRRGLSPEEINLLRERNAIGEALRYYFDKQGKIVFEVPGIGLEFSDLQNIGIIAAVAGGRNKADAIKAVLSHQHETVLITDEGAAREIVG